MESKVCPKCSAEYESKYQFCPKCGTRLSTKRVEVEPSFQTSQREVRAKEHKPLSKKKKLAIVFSCVGVVAITLGVLTPIVFVPAGKYNYAMKIVSTKPLEASRIFVSIKWKDSKKQFYFALARDAFNNSNYRSGYYYMTCGYGLTYYRILHNGQGTYYVYQDQPMLYKFSDYEFKNNNYTVYLTFTDSLL